MNLNKCLIKTSIVILLMTLFYNISTASESNQDLDRNEIDFELFQPSDNVNFDITRFDLHAYRTRHQEDNWGGIDGPIKHNNQTRFVVHTDRHGTETVAIWMKERLHYNQYMNGFGTGGDGDPQPNELNFAVQGDMIFNDSGVDYLLKDVILAQGHNTSNFGTNNWYFGAIDCRTQNSNFNSVECIAYAEDESIPLALRITLYAYSSHLIYIIDSEVFNTDAY